MSGLLSKWCSELEKVKQHNRDLLKISNIVGSKCILLEDQVRGLEQQVLESTTLHSDLQSLRLEVTDLKEKNTFLKTENTLSTQLVADLHTKVASLRKVRLHVYFNCTSICVCLCVSFQLNHQQEEELVSLRRDLSTTIESVNKVCEIVYVCSP